MEAEKRPVVFSATAAVDLRCEPVQSLAIPRATTNLCECVCGLPVCLPEAIPLTASKWQRALDLHLTAAGRKSIRPGIDLFPIRSLMDGERQLWLSGLSGRTNPYRVDWKGRCLYAANPAEAAVKFLNKQSDGRITLDLQNMCQFNLVKYKNVYFFK